MTTATKPSNQEPFITMSAPGYPATCNDCGTEATNATIADHECPPESEGFYLIHPGKGGFDVRGRDGTSPLGSFRERENAKAAQRILNLFVSMNSQIEEINNALRRRR